MRPQEVSHCKVHFHYRYYLIDFRLPKYRFYLGISSFTNKFDQFVTFSRKSVFFRWGCFQFAHGNINSTSIMGTWEHARILNICTYGLIQSGIVVCFWKFTLFFYNLCLVIMLYDLFTT